MGRHARQRHAMKLRTPEADDAVRWPSLINDAPGPVLVGECVMADMTAWWALIEDDAVTIAIGITPWDPAPRLLVLECPSLATACQLVRHIGPEHDEAWLRSLGFHAP